jgi:transposase-like protein
MEETELESICVGLAERVYRESARGLGKKWRCPADLRKEVVAYAVICQETGEALAPISERLGLVESTLARWLRQRELRRDVLRGFRSVAIVPSGEMQRPTCGPQLRLTTADGHIVEGLDLESAAYLLKAIR